MRWDKPQSRAVGRIRRNDAVKSTSADHHEVGIPVLGLRQIDPKVNHRSRRRHELPVDHASLPHSTGRHFDTEKPTIAELFLGDFESVHGSQ
jgi:hypothetical protein